MFYISIKSYINPDLSFSPNIPPVIEIIDTCMDLFILFYGCIYAQNVSNQFRLYLAEKLIYQY